MALPELYIHRENDLITLFWNGEGFTLEGSTNLAGPGWSVVPGPVTRSPLTVRNDGTIFYRLRQ